VLTVPVLIGLSLVTAALGTVGGLGGAMFLVPVLVVCGVDPLVAAPLGILTVAAGSLSAAPRQLEEGLVHHRLGVVLEIAASLGAIGGAVLSANISETLLSRILGLLAIAIALAGLRRTGLRNPPHGHFSLETPGEWPGTLAGAYRLRPDEVVPYQARLVPAGLAAMVASGVIAGLAGVGGGFIKTPAMREIMHVPIKVAAATTTFTVGITAATSLVVFISQGRLDYEGGAAVVVGGLIGGFVGSRIQSQLRPPVVRVVLSAALAIIGVVLVVTA
jgi:uncharacterized membrane protein YfcA